MSENRCLYNTLGVKYFKLSLINHVTENYKMLSHAQLNELLIQYYSKCFRDSGVLNNFPCIHVISWEKTFRSCLVGLYNSKR